MSLVFIIYILAAFSVLLGIGIVFLMISRNDSIKSSQYRSVMIFMCALLFYCLGYFCLFCKDYMMGDYTVGTVVSIVGGFLYSLIIYAWLCVIGELRLNDGNFERGHIFKWALILSLGRFIIYAIVMSLFVDNYYTFYKYEYGIAFSVVEAIYVLVTASVIMFYIQDFMRKAVNVSYRKYVLTISIVLCIWDIWQAIMDTCLYIGQFVSAWAIGIPDINGPIMIFLGISTFIFVFKEDFSPLFYVNLTEQLSEISYVDYAAEKHNLTVRETEVMKLMYEGYNNPEIAEKLAISRNTVKRHVQSIYEKMDINSRVELVHLVDTRPDKDK